MRMRRWPWRFLANRSKYFPEIMSFFKRQCYNKAIILLNLACGRGLGVEVGFGCGLFPDAEFGIADLWEIVL